MSSADAAVAAVLIMAPGLLIARQVIRRRRGEVLNADELIVAVGVVGIGVLVVMLARVPSILRFALPVALSILGVALLRQARQPASQQISLARVVAFLAVTAGLAGICAAIVQALGGSATG